MAGSPKVYKIHPAIGMARLGDAAADAFFIGPEKAGVPHQPEARGGAAAGHYKYGGRVRPQAARFRLFEYDLENGRLVRPRELTVDDPRIERIEWRVQLANRKASFHAFDGLAGDVVSPERGGTLNGPHHAKSLRNPLVGDRASLDITPPARTICGRTAGKVEFRWQRSEPGWPLDPDGKPIIEYLGELRTDEHGNLIVLGGRGVSRGPLSTLKTYANNDGWHDDVADGPVTVSVTVKPGTPAITVGDDGPAWVVGGPPDFAPGVGNVITLYDTLTDVAVRFMDMKRYRGALERLRRLADELHHPRTTLFTYRPDYNAEIRPILRRAYNVRWTFGPARRVHDGLVDPVLGQPAVAGAANPRKAVFDRLRPPLGVAAGAAQNMPKLLDDTNKRGLAVTVTQYALLRQWSEGDFISPSKTLPARLALPDELDRAALENAVGGAFFPGIEVGWQIRHASLFIEPFRIDHHATSTYDGESEQRIRAGHFSRQMALPWQADFYACQFDEGSGWWPGQRPDDVLASADATTTVKWGRPGPWGTVAGFDDMRRNWSRLGFVLADGDVFVERERNDR